MDAISNNFYRDMVKTEQLPNIRFQDNEQNSTNKNPSEDKAAGNNNQNDHKDRDLSVKQLKGAIDLANNKLKYTRSEFTYYKDINRVSIKVIDRETNEVIREIPPEETLELVKKLWEAAGLIIDERR